MEGIAMSYDLNRAYIQVSDMPIFEAFKGAPVAGHLIVRACELSNREYGHRHQKLAKSNNMKHPPSADRIFAGYLVVRNIDTPTQYETWMPGHVFEDLYRPAKAARGAA
ncbi:hypothetical protein L682_26910 [Aquipseudomonas alcaligenes OT 69]|nr:hypothetical protein L682_26910 [Pseudomonas alcaligenes OT 69]